MDEVRCEREHQLTSLVKCEDVRCISVLTHAGKSMKKKIHIYIYILVYLCSLTSSHWLSAHSHGVLGEGFFLPNILFMRIFFFFHKAKDMLLA